MNRIRTSFAIFSHSLALIGQHKKLLLFPLVNMVGLAVVLAFFAVPLLFETSVFTMGDELSAVNEMVQTRGDDDSEPLTIGRVTFREGGMDVPYLIVAAIYLMAMFLLTFVNVAFYHEILQAFSGNAVSLSRGVAFACTKLRAILVWSLLAGVVGLIIRKLEENVGFVGRWVLALVGFAWSVASVFAIPVIVREEQQSDPVAYLKTSASIIKRTWGEGLVGVVSIAAATVLLSLALMTAFTVVMFVLPFAIVYAIVGFSALMLILMYLSALMKDIFLCGLYVYATEGVVPGGYDAAVMENAWRVKKRKTI